MSQQELAAANLAAMSGAGAIADGTPAAEGDAGASRRERGDRPRRGRADRAERSDRTERADAPDADAAPQADASTAEPTEGGNPSERAPRERRSRDRYGRDRRERGPRDASASAADGSAPAENAAFVPNSAAPVSAEETPVRSSYFAQPASTATPAEAPVQAFFAGSLAAPAASIQEAQRTDTSAAVEQAPPEAAPVAVAALAALTARSEPVVPARAASPAAAPTAPKAAGLPRVQAYALPIDAMNQVAQSSGLEWVNSNPEKVAQVQAAIAAEPRPVHVPRVIPPVVVVNEGPLVLVETRKDLRSVTLPFETT